jgi:hypothetical protein
VFVGAGGFGVAVGAGGGGLGVLVGGPSVGDGGSVGVGGSGGIVGSGGDVGSGVSVGLTTTVGVAVNVGTKVLVAVGVLLGDPISPPREGPRNVAASIPKAQNIAAPRPNTKYVMDLVLIRELSLRYVVYYRRISVGVQIRYSHSRFERKHSALDRVAGMIPVHPLVSEWSEPANR